jgi:electron transport complex protein RnfB
MFVAVIQEEVCVGCTKCLTACPVDAIVGAAKWMHTVLSQECIGCKLCIAPCPMDCIEMKEIEGDLEADPLLKRERASLARKRYLAKQKRLEQNQKPRLTFCSDDPTYKLKIKEEIAAAVSRVKARKGYDTQTTT